MKIIARMNEVVEVIWLNVEKLGGAFREAFSADPEDEWIRV